MMTDDLTRLAEDAGALLPPPRGGRRELGWLPLVVQAGPLSAPILERVGFRTVGALQLLRDEAA